MNSTDIKVQEKFQEHIHLLKETLNEIVGVVGLSKNQIENIQQLIQV